MKNYYTYITIEIALTIKRKLLPNRYYYRTMFLVGQAVSITRLFVYYQSTNSYSSPKPLNIMPSSARTFDDDLSKSSIAIVGDIDSTLIDKVKPLLASLDFKQ
jgi:hypothetical protein